MDKNSILKSLNDNQIVYLATAEGKNPHVRAIALYRADDKGIIFHTGKDKDLNKQLLANPEVELCCYIPNSNIQIRVNGSVEIVDDLGLKKEVVANRVFMKPWIERFGYDMLVIYNIRKPRATIWTMETNFAPKSYIKL